jgi:hypothetical protein
MFLPGTNKWCQSRIRGQAELFRSVFTLDAVAHAPVVGIFAWSLAITAPVTL